MSKSFWLLIGYVMLVGVVVLVMRSRTLAVSPAFAQFKKQCAAHQELGITTTSPLDANTLIFLCTP